jgi:hypothetical protein
MNDFEIKTLYNQVQNLEEQVQLLVEALIGDDSSPAKKAKK